MGGPTFPLGTTVAGDPLAVDLDRLIGGHACVVANSGGGKSQAVRRLLEVTHGAIPQIVLDPDDEFYTLRQRYDFVIAGGDGADVPARVAGAGALARAALESGFNLIVQLNDLGEAAPEFVGAFLDALIGAPRELWRPLLVAVDEVHRFAPVGGRTAASAGVKALTGQGRKRGFTAVIASQRITKIHADVRGDINNWLLGRVGQALDRNAVADALGFTRGDARERLQLVEERHFWAQGPALSAEPVLFRVDDVATTPVRAGQAKLPTPPAPEALREILGRLATAAEPPAPEVREGPGGLSDASLPADPADAYRAGRAAGDALLERDRRIAELIAANAECADLITEQLDLLAKRDAQLSSAERAGDRAIGLAVEAHRSIEEVAAKLGADLLALLNREEVDEIPASGAEDAAGEVDDDPGTASPAAVARPGAAIRGRRALEALVANPGGLTERQWAWCSEMAIKGGSWTTYKSALRRDGLVEQRGGRWHATIAGIDAVGGIPEAPTPGRDLALLWGKRVDGVRRMVDVLLRRWPHAITRDVLAAELGMAASGGTFGTYLSRLRSSGMLQEKAKRIRLAPELMGEAG